MRSEGSARSTSVIARANRASASRSSPLSKRERPSPLMAPASTRNDVVALVDDDQRVAQCGDCPRALVAGLQRIAESTRARMDHG